MTRVTQAILIVLTLLIFSPASADMEIHFIDVGQGDAALIVCDGHAMIIDGGTPANSSKMYFYLQQHGIEHLDYALCTHIHDDHVGGMPGALNYATTDIGFAPFDFSDSSSAFDAFLRYLQDGDGVLVVPGLGDVYPLGDAQFEFVGPVYYDEYNNVNDTSLVIRLTYGNTSFLFTGDATWFEELDILDTEIDIRADVLKAGHHGSASSTTSLFLDTVLPEYVVVSVGLYNSYGHPTEEFLEKINERGITLYRTDYHGTVICYSDGENISFETENAFDYIPERYTPVYESVIGEGNEEYILNIKRMKFHYPFCSGANSISPANRLDYTGNREELIEQGYSPCGSCNP